MFKKIVEEAFKLLAKVSADYIIIGAAALIGAAFLFFLVTAIFSGTARFRKVAKNQLKKPFELGQNIAEFPRAIDDKWRYFLEVQTGRPSDYLTFKLCVDQPYSMSLGKSAPRGMLLTTVFLPILAFLIMLFKSSVSGVVAITAFSVFWSAALLILGLLLSLAVVLVRRGVYKRSVNIYNKFINELNFSVLGEIPVDRQSAAFRKDIQDNGNTDAQTFPVVPPSPTEFRVIGDDEPSAEPEVEPIAEEMVTFTTMEEVPESQPVKVKEEAPVKEEPQDFQISSAVEEFLAEEARLAEERRAALQREAEEEKSRLGPVALSLIERVGTLVQEGATLAEMKELALDIQKERNRPENSGAEKKRQLNSALTRLLRIMSNTKR